MPIHNARKNYEITWNFIVSSRQHYGSEKSKQINKPILHEENIRSIVLVIRRLFYEITAPF